MEKGKIELTRTSQYANYLRSIKIYIDNVEVQSIADGETKSFEVDAGQYEIFAKIDWCKTRPLRIDIRKNETTELELGSEITGWKMLFVPIYLTFMTKDYLYLKKK